MRWAARLTRGHLRTELRCQMAFPHEYAADFPWSPSGSDQLCGERFRVSCTISGSSNEKRQKCSRCAFEEYTRLPIAVGVRDLDSHRPDAEHCAVCTNGTRSSDLHQRLRQLL